MSRVGIISVFLFLLAGFVYLQILENPIIPRVKHKVAVATKDLKGGHVLTPDDFAIKTLYKLVPSDAIRNPSIAIGKKLSYSVKKGQFIVNTGIEDHLVRYKKDVVKGQIVEAEDLKSSELIISAIPDKAVRFIEQVAGKKALKDRSAGSIAKFSDFETK